MAQPRIFISSTFYDLKHVRNDLERFILDLGYEPIMNERGQIAYNTNKENLDESCYKAISTADILVSIVGGRFGSTASHDRNHASISQTEVKTAIEQKKQVFIFIEKGVFHEYKTYQNNKEQEIKYVHVDNKKIYEYIDYLYDLNTMVIHPFEASNEIVVFLKEQFAGLFERFLREQKQKEELNSLKKLSDYIQTLAQTTQILQSQLNDKIKTDDGIKEIFFSTHPAVQKIKELLKIKFQFYFSNKVEMTSLLKAYDYEEVKDNNVEKYFIWYKMLSTVHSMIKWDRIKIAKEIFDDKHRLKTANQQLWEENFITQEIIEENIVEGDIPF